MSGPLCRRCNVLMWPGHALQSTMVTGTPDFPGDTGEERGQTISEGGPGVLVEVWKCPRCGHSLAMKDGPMSRIQESAEENEARVHGDASVQDRIANALRIVRPNLADDNMRRTWYSLVSWHWNNIDVQDPDLMERFMSRAGVPD